MQIVSYWADDADFTEGPFVAVRHPASYEPLYRIEAQTIKDTGESIIALRSLSVCRLLDAVWGIPAGWMTEAQATKYVDWLNAQVQLGRIVQKNGSWIAPEYHQ